jgi:hypothetical protein
MHMRGRLLSLSYRLGRHFVGPFSAGAWLVLLGIGVLLYDALPRTRVPLALDIAGGLLAVGTLALLTWGRMRGYCSFVSAEPHRPASEPLPLRGLDHLRVRATGTFQVEGRARRFADLDALYHTFETREHAVMAHVPRTRFLLAGSRREDIGMWYVFFRPERIQSVDPGVVYSEGRPRPALFVRYSGEKQVSDMCLAFENEDDQARALADLRHDVRDAGSTGAAD